MNDGNQTLITRLHSLNSKERYFVVREIFGLEEKPKLSDTFIKKISTELEISIPEEHHVFIDFHLDWVVAAVSEKINTNNTFINQKISPPHGKDKPKTLITGTQEDIDVLVAYVDSKKSTNLIFIEAKGVESWNKNQLISKALWLNKLLIQKNKVCKVKFHFLLLSQTVPNLVIKKMWLGVNKGDKKSHIKLDCNNNLFAV